MDRKFAEQWLNNLKEAWWNKDIEWLKKHWECMSDIEEFKRLITKEEIEKCSHQK